MILCTVTGQSEEKAFLSSSLSAFPHSQFVGCHFAQQLQVQLVIRGRLKCIDFLGGSQIQHIAESKSGFIAACVNLSGSLSLSLASHII
jgi:hypothetical protein